jgi:hypothetical protein
MLHHAPATSPSALLEKHILSILMGIRYRCAAKMASKSDAFALCEPFASSCCSNIAITPRRSQSINNDDGITLEPIPTTCFRGNRRRVDSVNYSATSIEVEDMGNHSRSSAELAGGSSTLEEAQLACLPIRCWRCHHDFITSLLHAYVTPSVDCRQSLIRTSLGHCSHNVERQAHQR